MPHKPSNHELAEPLPAFRCFNCLWNELSAPCADCYMVSNGWTREAAITHQRKLQDIADGSKTMHLYPASTLAHIIDRENADEQRRVDAEYERLLPLDENPVRMAKMNEAFMAAGTHPTLTDRIGVAFGEPEERIETRRWSGPVPPIAYSDKLGAAVEYRGYGSRVTIPAPVLAPKPLEMEVRVNDTVSGARGYELIRIQDDGSCLVRVPSFWTETLEEPGAEALIPAGGWELALP